MREDKTQITLAGIARTILPTLVWVGGFLALLVCLNVAGLLPAPAVSAQPDTAALVHQAASSHARDPARTIILGDSTCLMGVDPLQLSRDLHGESRVLSLAMVVWLDLGVYGQALSDFDHANPGQVERVILLVSPAKLVGGGNAPVTAESEMWREIESASGAGSQKFSAAKDWFGIRLLRQNVLSHVWDTPVYVQGEAFFGFSSQIDRYQTAHRGGLIEPGTFLNIRKRQKTGWKLSPAVEAETREFRTNVPAGAKLYIGITPVPKFWSSPGDRDARDSLLRDWNRTMKADVLLTNLPVTLPNVCFSRTGHLNEFGQRKYTESLRKSLELKAR